MPCAAISEVTSIIWTRIAWSELPTVYCGLLQPRNGRRGRQSTDIVRIVCQQRQGVTGSGGCDHQLHAAANVTPRFDSPHDRGVVVAQLGLLYPGARSQMTADR